MVKPVTMPLIVQAVLTWPFNCFIHFSPLSLQGEPFQGFGHHADIEGLVFLAGVKAFTLQTGEFFWI